MSDNNVTVERVEVELLLITEDRDVDGAARVAAARLLLESLERRKETVVDPSQILSHMKTD